MCGHTDDCKKLSMLLVSKPFGACSRRMRVSAVRATIHGGHGNVDQFLCQWIEYPRLNHHLLNAQPGLFQHVGLVRQRTPEIIYKSDLRVTRMSSKIACNAGTAAISLSVQSFTVAIGYVFP